MQIIRSRTREDANEIPEIDESRVLFALFGLPPTRFTIGTWYDSPATFLCSFLTRGRATDQTMVRFTNKYGICVSDLAMPGRVRWITLSPEWACDGRWLCRLVLASIFLCYLARDCLRTVYFAQPISGTGKR